MYDSEDQMNMTSELAVILIDDPLGARATELRSVRIWIIAMIASAGLVLAYYYYRQGS